MSDIIPKDAAYPHWKQLCLAGVSELDPTKLPRRLADARSAVLDRIEDNFSKPSNDEQLALRNALDALAALRAIVQGKIA